MKRRTFLTALVAIPAMSVLPEVRAAETLGTYGHAPMGHANGCASVAYGDCVFFSGGDVTPELIAEAKEVLQPGIDAMVPADQQHAIHWTIQAPLPTPGDPLGQRGLIGWRWYAPLGF